MHRNAFVEIDGSSVRFAPLLDRDAKPFWFTQLFAFWLKSDFRLIPLEMDIAHGRNHINLGCNFTKAFRERVKQANDVHCELSHDGETWVRMSKIVVRPLFQEDAASQLYAELPGPNTNELRGCAIGYSRLWWVVVTKENVALAGRDLLFRLWECILNWVDRAGRALERTFSSLPSRSIEIRLILPNFPQWDFGKRNAKLATSAALSVSASCEKSTIDINIPEGFLSEFNQPKNTAERFLIGAIIDGAALLASTTIAAPLRNELIEEIAGNQDARYFHIVESHDLQQMLGELGQPEPLFVADEDRSMAALGLAQLAAAPTGNNLVYGLEETRKFLENCVIKVWERVELKLKNFNRDQVVATAFDALDDIGRDAQHWQLTARSVFALHKDRENVHQVTHERRLLRGEENLANRILIETAQYTCSQQSNKLFNRADHLTLLADLSLLLNLAQHRDAIAFGYIEPSITLHPNGELDLEMEFYTQTFSKFFAQQSIDATEAASVGYDQYFESAESVSSNSAVGEKENSQLDAAFLSEYGFSVDSCVAVLDELRGASQKRGTANFQIDENNLRILTEKRCNFTTQEADKFIATFTLPIRAAWDKDLPPSCRKEDVFPWRFRRRVSLLFRPFVELSENPRTWMVSATFFGASLNYILHNIQRGSFPQHIFRSDQMRRYWGVVAHKRGHEFAKQVEEVSVTAHLSTRLEVEMTSIGAPKQGGLGDVDVIAWQASSGIVYLVECKRLQPVNSVREVIQRLEDFQGDEKNKDSLGRHLRRVGWIEKKPQRPRETVPMQFYDNIKFPASQVVPIEALLPYLMRPENR